MIGWCFSFSVAVLPPHSAPDRPASRQLHEHDPLARRPPRGRELPPDSGGSATRARRQNAQAEPPETVRRIKISLYQTIKQSAIRRRSPGVFGDPGWRSGQDSHVGRHRGGHDPGHYGHAAAHGSGKEKKKFGQWWATCKQHSSGDSSEAAETRRDVSSSKE